MNICFEWIISIFIKWIMFWTNILVLVCLRQKWLSPNVSNSSEITHGSLVGPISVHFSGLLPILGPQEGSAAITWPHLGILNNFPHFFWMNNSIEYSGLYWMNIFFTFQNGSARAMCCWKWLLQVRWGPCLKSDWPKYICKEPLRARLVAQVIVKHSFLPTLRYYSSPYLPFPSTVCFST